MKTKCIKTGFPLLLILLLAAGCHKHSPDSPSPRPRLITYSPALTRIVFDMGLGDYVVGITHFCQLPPGRQRPRIGDNLNVQVEPILSVHPDIILAQIAEKNFAALRQINPAIRIENFRFDNLQDIASAMQRIGEIARQPEAGSQARRDFLQKLEQVRQRVADLPKQRVIFVIDYKAPSGAGRNTFVDEMIERANGVNLLAADYDLWKKVSLEKILTLDPEVLICHAEKNQSDETLRYWRDLTFAGGKKTRVYVVTDPDWLIPAGHLAEYTMELAKMIHPELAPPEAQP